MAAGAAEWPPKTIATAASRVASALVRRPQAKRTRHVLVSTSQERIWSFELPQSSQGGMPEGHSLAVLIDYRIVCRRFAAPLLTPALVRSNVSSSESLDTADDLVNEHQQKMASPPRRWRLRSPDSCTSSNEGTAPFACGGGAACDRSSVCVPAGPVRFGYTPMPAPTFATSPHRELLETVQRVKHELRRSPMRAFK
jgi:hypothetical protein